MTLPLEARSEAKNGRLYVSELVGLLFPATRRHHCLLMRLAAHFDASQTTEGARVLSLAGYLSTVYRWEQADAKWRRLMKRHDLPFFHMTDFENGRGPYRGLSETRRITLLRRLHSLIHSAALLGVASSVVLDDYEALDAPSRTRLGYPYFICASWCMGQIGKWLKEQNIRQPVAYVFEVGDQGAGRLLTDYSRAPKRSLLKLHVRSITFARKAELAGLQMADIQAYEAAKNIPKRLGKSSRPVRKSLANLLKVDTPEHRHQYFDAAGLQWVLNAPAWLFRYGDMYPERLLHG